MTRRKKRYMYLWKVYLSLHVCLNYIPAGPVIDGVVGALGALEPASDVLIRCNVGTREM